MNSTVLANEQINLLKKELNYKTSRSGGKGGQNVNKVETKVEITYNLYNSRVFSEEQKQKLSVKLKNKLNEEGELRIVSENFRTQLENKNGAVKKLISLLNQALKMDKKRKATKPTKAGKESRLDTKKRRGETKQLRRKFRSE